jgi:hypothetical protein
LPPLPRQIYRRHHCFLLLEQSVSLAAQGKNNPQILRIAIRLFPLRR